jgi:hypothetical protein
VLNKKDHKKFKDKLNLLSNLESHWVGESMRIGTPIIGWCCSI